MDTITVNPYYTLIIATVVLLVGRALVNKIKFLQNFNIPEPVAGGLVAAVIIYALYLFNHVSGIEYNDCCWAWRLAGKHWRDKPEDDKKHNAIYLEFVLKGLGNMGNRSGRMLKNEIHGFTPLAEEHEF